MLTNFPVIISATFNVAAGQTALTSMNDRVMHYISALEDILKVGVFSNLVFCENTGASLDLIRSKIVIPVGVNVEFLSFVGDAHMVSKRGKGFGEGEIIKFCINNSELLKNASHFFKITGRLSMNNISAVVSNATRHDSVFFLPPQQGALIDTRFYFVSKNFYSMYLLDSYLSVSDNDGYYLERVFYDAIFLLLKPKSICQYPDFVGISGSTGRPYKLGAFRYVKICMLAILKRMCFVV